jgi:RNA polymerase sigma-70 factor (ECF subfamily)
MAEASPAHLQALIDRLQAADPAARKDLLAHTFERLRRLARKMLRTFGRVRHWYDTDDVLQNAALRLFRSLEATPPRSSAEFFGLAALQIRRELLDLTRRIDRLPPLAPAPCPPGSAAALEAEQEASTWEPRRLALWQQFHEEAGTLPPRERDVFNLVWYHGLSQAEAAAVLKVSVPTVKRWWQAARQRLKAALQGQEPGG